MSVREHMDRLGNLQPFGQQAEWTVALYDWMLAVTAALTDTEHELEQALGEMAAWHEKSCKQAAELKAKGCSCGNVRNRADNTRAFCPHCNGIDAKGQS